MSISDGVDLRRRLEELNDLEEIDFGTLLPDLHEQSPAYARWSEQLDAYLAAQGALDALRLRPSDEAPWPDGTNPMLSYLRERAAELVSEEGLDAAIAWLARQAWFEAAIAERARMSRLLIDDHDEH